MVPKQFAEKVEAKFKNKRQARKDLAKKETESTWKTEDPSVRAKRPVDYDFEIAIEICEQIAEGRSLNNVVKENPEYPSVGTILKWVHSGKYPEFSEMYKAARRDQADSGFERIMGLVEKVEKGHMSGNDARVAIDALKWVIGKLRPERYSDKIQVEADSKVSIEVVNYVVDAEVQKQIRQVTGALPDPDTIDVEPEDEF